MGVVALDGVPTTSGLLTLPHSMDTTPATARVATNARVDKKSRMLNIIGAVLFQLTLRGEDSEVLELLLVFWSACSGCLVRWETTSEHEDFPYYTFLYLALTQQFWLKYVYCSVRVTQNVGP